MRTEIPTAWAVATIALAVLAAGRPWGRLLATVVATSGATYTLLLAGMGVSADPRVVEGARALIPMWLALTVIAGAVSVTGLRSLPARPLDSRANVQR